MSARAKSSAKRAKGAKRAKPSKAARPRTKAKGKAATVSKAPKAAPAAQVRQRRPCAAQDPFGGPCQSSPRPGSAFCTIHSYLERTA